MPKSALKLVKMKRHPPVTTLWRGLVRGKTAPCYGGERGGGGGWVWVVGCVIRASGALRGVLKEYTSGGTSDISEIGAKVKE